MVHTFEVEIHMYQFDRDVCLSLYYAVVIGKFDLKSRCLIMYANMVSLSTNKN